MGVAGVVIETSAGKIAGTAAGDRLPVMVWIYGGGWKSGHCADPGYDGEVLARGGVVMVTFNYCVGFEGFGYVPWAPANRGFLDQAAALMWVRENIAALGGDPDNVTLFGESGGGASVAALLSAPAARGLFRRAIVQSMAGRFLPEEEARRIAALTAEALGKGLDQLASVPPQALLSVQDVALPAMRADPAKWTTHEAITSFVDLVRHFGGSRLAPLHGGPPDDPHLGRRTDPRRGPAPGIPPDLAQELRTLTRHGRERTRGETCGPSPPATFQGRSKSWRIPPAEKQSAPVRVPQLAMSPFTGLPVAGRVKAASAETRKRTEPSWLIATIHQPRSRARTAGRPWQTSSSARCPEIRNRVHPTMSGAQISLFTCWSESPCSRELSRLIPNTRVPTNSTKVLSQSIR